MFPVDLHALPRGRTYASASVRVTLAGPELIAIGLNPADDIIDALIPPAGHRDPSSDRLEAVPRPREGVARSAIWSRRPVTEDPTCNCVVTGLWTPSFGWSVTPSGREMPPTLAMGALIEAPQDCREVSGEIRADAVVARSFLGLVQRSEAESLRALPFTVRVGVTGDTAGSSIGESRSGAAGGRAVRLIVSADTEGYSTLGIDDARQAQADLVHVLDRAVAATGLAGMVHQQDQGDCRQLVFPAGCDELEILPLFYLSFRETLRAVNRRRGAPLRLRWAADHGHAGRAAAGWDGQAPIAVARLRDSAPARSRFAAAPTADFVLTVSDALYGDVVRQLTREPLPASFTAVDVDEPNKGYRARGWVHLPVETPAPVVARGGAEGHDPDGDAAG
jgi:hypothetical protein